MKTLLFSFIILASLPITAFGQEKKNGLKDKNAEFEIVDFEGIIRRYLGKDAEPLNPVEGIYSVSCTVYKRKKAFLSSREKERIVKRQDNYAKVAIIKDWPDSKREFIEISLGSKVTGRYPIVGEFNSLSERGGFIYHHFEPGGELLNLLLQ